MQYMPDDAKCILCGESMNRLSPTKVRTFVQPYFTSRINNRDDIVHVKTKSFTYKKRTFKGGDIFAHRDCLYSVGKKESNA